MTSTFDKAIADALDNILDKVEREYESERLKVEQILAECGKEKVQPAKDYWHRLDYLRRKVNMLRKITEINNGGIKQKA